MTIPKDDFNSSSSSNLSLIHIWVYLSVSLLLLLSSKTSEHHHVFVNIHTPLERFYHLSCCPKAGRVAAAVP